MKLVIGLGNPGEKYKNNRHSVGNLFIDWLSANVGWPKGAMFLKTENFMNDSGESVKRFVEYYKIPVLESGFLQPAASGSTPRIAYPDVFIVHDDLDIRLGGYKIQMGVGPKVHYGLQSIERDLKTVDFWRVRIGVDSRDPTNRTPGEDYMLGDFTEEEMKTIVGEFPGIWEELQQKLES